MLAEEIVEEWLNRNGYFTIRGVKLGVQEIDLLALGYIDDKILCRHVEVQASVRPLSYLCPLPKEVQKITGRKANSVKERSREEMSIGVDEWIKKKYHIDVKENLRNHLYPGVWKLELVIHHVKFEEELDLVRGHGIVIHRLDDIIAELASSKSIVPSASGSDLMELIMLGRS